MRGSPLLRALLAFCLIAALGWPLWRLTNATAVPAAPVPDLAPQAKATRLQLDFTTVPQRFTVSHVDREVWAENAPRVSMEREISLVFPENGVDLVFHIEWPEGTAPMAARVRLTDPAGDTYEKSVWGAATVDEALTFP